MIISRAVPSCRVHAAPAHDDNGTRSHSAGGHHRPPQHAGHLSPHRQKVHLTQRCPGVRLFCGSLSDDCSTQSSPPCHHQESQYLSWKTQQEQEWSISTLRDRVRPRTRKIDSIRCRDSRCPAVRGRPDTWTEHATELDEQSKYTCCVHCMRSRWIPVNWWGRWVAEDIPSKVKLTVGIRLAGHSRPGQVKDVEGNKAGL